jgi:autotransporter-associated beta strand protein
MKAKKNLLNSRIQKTVVALGTCVLFAFNGTAKADDANWTGNTSADWNLNDTTNWNTATDTTPNVPTSTSTYLHVNTGSGSFPVPVISADETLPHAGGVLIGQWYNTGRIDHVAGTVTWAGDVNLGWGVGNATYNLADTTTTGGAFTGYGIGSGSANIGGTLSLGGQWGWQGGHETFNVNTSGTLAVTWDLIIGRGNMGVSWWDGGNGVGTMNVDAGTVTAGGTVKIGFDVNHADGNVGQAKGALNVSGGSFSCLKFDMGFGTNSTTSENIGVMTITGGEVNATGTDRWYPGAGVRLAAATDSGNGGTATVNLDGGTLSTFNVYSEDHVNNNGTPDDNTDDFIDYTKGTSTFNFNGGTLKAIADTSVFYTDFMLGLTAAYVKSGGAVIDSNGFNIKISQQLLTDETSTGGGLTKNGDGQLEIAAAFTYTGDTTVNTGTLSVQSASFDDASTITIADGATLNLNTGAATDTVASLVLADGTQPNGTYGAIGSGAQHETAQITGNGFIQVGPPASGYSAWAGNVGGATADLDTNSDGVDNGIAYFMNNTGVISLPGVVGGAVTWTNGGNIAADQYGTQFVVQTSQNLVDWTPVSSGSLTTNTDGPSGSLTYTLPTGQGKWFVRLVVTPN